MVTINDGKKYEIHKLNINNFSLWKVNLNVILRKNNYLVAIGERARVMTNETKWNEIENNAITDLYLAFADKMLCSVEEIKMVKEI